MEVQKAKAIYQVNMLENEMEEVKKAIEEEYGPININLVDGSYTKVEVEPKVEINISDIVVNAEVIVDDILIDPGIEITAIDDVIEQVITPDEGTIIVSPSGQLYASTQL